MASLLSLTICDSHGDDVEYSRLVALIVCIVVSISQIEGATGHGSKIE